MSQNKDLMRDRIYLAALLHDIGKFYQRADSGSVQSSKELNDFVKNLESVFCPLTKDHARSHKHVLWTAQFLEKFRPVFLKLNQDSDWQDFTIQDSLLHLAASHHLSAAQLTEAGRIIREADHLSSGMDRSSDESLKDDQAEKGWDAFKRIRMTSLFEGLLKSGTEFKSEYHLPAESLSINREAFPAKSFEDSADYKNLWERFTGELKFVQSSNLRAFSETFLYLLHKYTSTIPSSTINFPDVSLFDHLKTTAAIAVSLYDWQKGEKAGDEPFLMIGGDFCGIQSYIYNIISENAAKNLKGRSFYLKLLSDSVVMFLLKELELYEANIIYNSGGSFFILAPNTTKVIEKLKEVEKTIENRIFETHGTSLYVALANVPLSRNALMGLQGESIGKCWDELFRLRDNQKKCRYTERLVKDYSLFFEPGEAGGLTARDAITGEELALPLGKNAFTLEGKKPGNNDEPVIGSLTWKQIRLGKVLKSSKIWVISDGELNYWPEKESINPGNLGFYYYFLSDKDVEAKREQLKASADQVKIISINANDQGHINFLNSAILGTDNIYGFDFFGGNDFPQDDDGSPKSFDQLAGAEGYKRLGILRMDVDNLGNIFQKGFGDNRNSFSRYAALSRSLDWFFKGYLNSLWKEKFSKTTYIIYSGGDDLFIVGRWNDCIDLAELIYNEFKAFVCQNPSLTLSGGLAIVTPKFPTKRGAQESEEAEKQAKNYSLKNKDIISEKDAFSLLGLSLGWKNEYPAVKQLKHDIHLTISNKSLNKSFISKINLHFTSAKFENEKLVSPKTYWMSAYDFGRMESSTKIPDIKAFLKKCRLDIVSDTVNGIRIPSRYHSFKLWHLAARWAELENRTI